MVTRRNFIRNTAALGTGIIGVSVAGCTTTLTTTVPTTTVPTTTIPPTEGGDIVFATRGFPGTCDPRYGHQRMSPSIWAHSLESLVNFDRDMNVVPQLAESWEQVDDTTVDFTLHSGVMFHPGAQGDYEGHEFIAQDVVDQFDVILDNHPISAALVQFKGQYQNIIGSVEEINDYEVRFNLKKIAASFLQTMACYQTVQVMPGEEWKLDEKITHWVGTGPYQYEEEVNGEYHLLSKFDDYWGTESEDWHAGPNYLDSIKVKVISDEGTREAALETGEIHAMEISTDTTEDLVNADPDLVLDTLDGTRFHCMSFNMRKSPANDVRFREMLQCSIDWVGARQSIFPGQTALSTLFADTQVEDATMVAKLPTYDTARADELNTELEDAGLKGETISMVKITPFAAESFVDVVKTVLEGLGWTASINTVQAGPAVHAARFGEGRNDWDVIVQGTQPMAIENMHTAVFETYHSSGGIGADGSCEIGLADSTMDDLIIEADETLDDDDRIALYQEIGYYIYDRFLTFPVVREKVRTAYTNKLNNVKLTPAMRRGLYRLGGAWLES